MCSLIPTKLKHKYANNSVIASKSMGNRGLEEMKADKSDRDYRNEDGSWNEMAMAEREFELFEKCYPQMKFTRVVPL